MLATVYPIQAGDRTYAVTDDLTTSYQVLVSGAVQDEIDSCPLEELLSLQVSRPDLDAKVLPDGSYVLSGHPELSFPDLATSGYSVTIALSAPAYRPQTLIVNLPAGSTFPVTAGMVALRRLPVRVQGRVVKLASNRTPVSGAKMTAVDDPTGPAPAHPCALRSPLYFDHAAGVAVHEKALTPAGAAKQLAADVAAGNLTLALSDRSGLAAGQILAVGPDIHLEYAVIDSLDPEPSDLTRPGNATLRNGLNHSFAAGTAVQPVSAGATGTSRNLAADANTRDGILLLDGLLNVGAVEVADPAAPKVEYHAVGALTDADGFYCLDGAGRVSILFLNASAAGLHDSTLGRSLDYGRPVNVLDFRLSP